MTVIEPIGRVHPVDADGRLVRDADASLIPPHWRPLCDAAVEVYRDGFGQDLHSVYLRGSVVRGHARDGIADLDSFAVVDLPPTHGRAVHVPWGEAASERLHAAYPFCESVEVWALSRDAALHGPRARSSRVMLAIHTLCLYGEDLGATLPRPRPGPDTVFMLPNIDGIIADAAQGLVDGVPAARLCRWVAKMVLRAGMEAVIADSGAYTRDLWPCYDLFARHRPEAAAAMYRMLELAIDPIDDYDAVTEVIDQVRPFLR